MTQQIGRRHKIVEDEVKIAEDTSRPVHSLKGSFITKSTPFGFGLK